MSLSGWASFHPTGCCPYIRLNGNPSGSVMATRKPPPGASVKFWIALAPGSCEALLLRRISARNMVEESLRLTFQVLHNLELRTLPPKTSWALAAHSRRTDQTRSLCTRSHLRFSWRPAFQNLNRLRVRSNARDRSYWEGNYGIPSMKR